LRFSERNSKLYAINPTVTFTLVPTLIIVIDVLPAEKLQTLHEVIDLPNTEDE